jgi:ABC-2 type transport system ATP-binding protein
LEIRRRIGYVSDTPALYEWMTTDEIGWFAAGFYEEGFLARFRELVAEFDLPLDARIKHLSKGRQGFAGVGDGARAESVDSG